MPDTSTGACFYRDLGGTQAACRQHKLALCFMKKW
jgi:hypothetical protein